MATCGKTEAPHVFRGGLSDILFSGAGGQARTDDLLFTKQLLYQLSYTGLRLYCSISRGGESIAELWGAWRLQSPFIRGVRGGEASPSISFWRLSCGFAARQSPEKGVARDFVPRAPDFATAMAQSFGGLTAALPHGMLEVLGLRWSDIDFAAHTLRVAQTVQRVSGRLLLAPPKTESSKRLLPLPVKVERALARHAERQEQERATCGEDWNAVGLVFPSETGTPIEPRNLVRHFKTLLQRAGLPNIRFHDLRHGCPTVLISQGVHPPPRDTARSGAGARSALYRARN